MTSAPSSLKPAGPTTKMMPEGSQKVCVLSGSHQIDQVVRGGWTALKVLPEDGLLKGICQLGEATKASSGKDASFIGQMLFSDSKTVYQPSGKGVVRHPRSTLAGLGTRSEKIIGGRSYTVVYANDKGVVSNAQTANAAQLRVTSKGYGASM